MNRRNGATEQDRPPAVEFPKTHRLDELLALVPARLRPRLTEEEQDRLTEYADRVRHGDPLPRRDYDPILLAEARGAVALARRVRGPTRLAPPK